MSRAPRDKIRALIDPARIHDIEREQRARARPERIRLETQRNAIAAQLQLAAVATSTQRLRGKRGNQRAVVVADAQRAIALRHRCKPPQEPVPVFALRRGPAHFCDRCGPGQRHQLHALFRSDVLRPDVRLQSQHMLLLVRREGGIARLKSIHVFKRDDSHPARWLRRTRALAVVEIERGPRRQNGVVPRERGGVCAVDAAP